MNRMSIIGNLTKDPELRVTQSGINVCSFTVAVNKRKRNQNGEEVPPMFYRVTVWRQLAEICGKYLQKGSKIYADGDLSVSQFQRNDGTTGFSLEIEGQNVEFLSGNRQDVQNVQAPVQEPPKQHNHQIGFTEVHLEQDELPF